jgi:hypothetical protein
VKLPRTADGHPDLSGVWEMYAEGENPELLFNLASDLKPGDVPFLPWAEATYKQRDETHGKDHRGAQCLPSGILTNRELFTGRSSPMAARFRTNLIPLGKATR